MTYRQIEFRRSFYVLSLQSNITKVANISFFGDRLDGQTVGQSGTLNGKCPDDNIAIVESIAATRA